MLEDLERRVEIIKREVDALQIAAARQSNPWYKNVSVLLSIIALLFSFSTTYESNRRIADQNIQSTRQELRGLLQRLAALPKENMEAGKKFQDPGEAAFISGLISQENSLLARNAAELAKKLPETSVSATEYYAVAAALQNGYDLAGAQEFLNYSTRASPDFSTEISALRMLAHMRFVQGNPEAGRVEYQKALSIFSKYPQYDGYTRTSTNIWTEISWAFSEASIASFSTASQHVDNAEALLTTLAHSPGASSLRAQVSNARSQISGGKPPISPATGSQLTPLSSK